jgi:hypothetical protein
MMTTVFRIEQAPDGRHWEVWRGRWLWSSEMRVLTNKAEAWDEVMFLTRSQMLSHLIDVELRLDLTWL